MNIVFCNIGWMKYYDGITEGDQISSGGSYVDKNNFGTEQLNFSEVDGYYYGYVATKSRNNQRNQFHIERFKDVTEDDEEAENILVVWVAKRPHSNESVIVGWYKNATVYRYYQEESFAFYNVKAKVEDCILLPMDKRNIHIYRANVIGTGKGMGQSNVWYAQEKEGLKVVENVLNKINSYDGEKLNDYYTEEELKGRTKVKLNTAKEYINDAVALLEDGKNLDALQYLNKALDLEPENPEVLNTLGHTLAGLRKYNFALKNYNKVLELDPQYSDVYFNRAMLYEEIGMLKEALDDYDKVLAFNPKDDEVYFKKAYILFYRLGEIKAAEEAIKRAINISNDFYGTYELLAKILFELRNYPDAIKVVEEAIKLNPDNYELKIFKIKCGKMLEEI